MPDSGLLATLRRLEYHGPARAAFLVQKPAPGVHELQDEVVAVVGSGFAGDHDRKSWYRGAVVPGREVTAIALEVLRVMRLGPDVTGDNLVTEGIDLHTLRPGDRLRVGAVEIERSERDHRPCATFRDRAGAAAFEAAAAGFRGALFYVRTGGPMAVNDPIVGPIRSE